MDMSFLLTLLMSLVEVKTSHHEELYVTVVSDFSFSSTIFGITAGYGDNLIMAESQSVWLVNVFDNPPTKELIAGSQGFSGYQEGSGVNALFRQILSVTLDDNAKVFVTDGNNRCIRTIQLDTNTTSTYAGICGTYGNLAGFRLNATFGTPYDVLRIGVKLYITDRSYHSLRLLENDHVTTLYSGTPLRNPAYLAGCNENTIYISFDHGVVRFDVDFQNATLVTGSSSNGNAINGADLESSRYSYPEDITMLNSHVLLLVENVNNMLRVIDFSNDVVESVCSGLSGHTSGNKKNCTLGGPWSLYVHWDTVFVGDGNVLRTFPLYSRIDDQQNEKCPLIETSEALPTTMEHTTTTTEVRTTNTECTTSTTAMPSETAERTTSTTEVPSTTIERTQSTTEALTTTMELNTTTTEVQTSTMEHTPATTEAPTTTMKRTTSTNGVSSTTTERTTSTTEVPITTTQTAPSTTESPATITGSNTSTGERPTLTSKIPSTLTTSSEGRTEPGPPISDQQVMTEEEQTILTSALLAIFLAAGVIVLVALLIKRKKKTQPLPPGEVSDNESMEVVISQPPRRPKFPKLEKPLKKTHPLPPGEVSDNESMEVVISQPPRRHKFAKLEKPLKKIHQTIRISNSKIAPETVPQVSSPDKQSSAVFLPDKSGLNQTEPLVWNDTQLPRPQSDFDQVSDAHSIEKIYPLPRHHQFVTDYIDEASQPQRATQLKRKVTIHAEPQVSDEIQRPNNGRHKLSNELPTHKEKDLTKSTLTQSTSSQPRPVVENLNLPVNTPTAELPYLTFSANSLLTTEKAPSLLPPITSLEQPDSVTKNNRKRKRKRRH